jgi:Ferredoxin-like domain in Api92-like protein
MANNCNNYITISGNKTEIKALYDLISDEVTANGYDKYTSLLSVYEKGTNDPKWFDIYATLEDENQLTISGDTAWCPALEVFTEISKLNPSFKIHYEYEEGGCDFAGYADIKEGVITDNCFTYWKGLIATDKAHALDYAITNQLEDFENEAEFITSDMYTAFEADEQEILLQEYRNLINN